MSDRMLRAISARRRVAGLTLATLVLAGCTGSSEPSGTGGAGEEGQSPVVRPTGTAADATPAGVDQENRYPDPLSDNEVVNGRRAEAGAFPAIWPETSRAELALTQLATLHGRERWRLSPEETAERFAVEVLGWTRSEVRSKVRPPKHPWWPMCEVTVRNAAPSDTAPVTLSMRAFAPWGSNYQWWRAEPGMAWSVERADTHLLALDALFDEVDPTVLRLAGALTVTDPTTVDVTIDLFDGPLGRPSVPFPGGVTSLGEGLFHARGEVDSPSGDGSAAIAVTLTDRSSGALLGLDALPLGGRPRTGGLSLDSPVHPHRRIWPLASNWYVSRRVAAASGSRSWRETPGGTAERFAVEALGWAPEDVASLVVDGWDSTVVAVWNERLPDTGRQPPLTLVTVESEVICISTPSPSTDCSGWNRTGHFTVVSADSALLELDHAAAEFGRGSLRIGVSFDGASGTRHLEPELSDGAAGTGQAPWIRLERSSAEPGYAFSRWSVHGEGWITALVYLVDDATGVTLAADAFPIEIPDAGVAA